MKHSLAALAAGVTALAFAHMAAAQSAAPPTMSAHPPANTLTVTGKAGAAPPLTAVEAFTRAEAAPSGRRGKIARWDLPVCAMTIGLKPEFGDVVAQRVNQVAAQVGARAASGKCEPNVAIIFTTDPQALLDRIAVKREELLGYHQSPIEAERLAKVTRPIQAWYVTATADFKGALTIDYCPTCQGWLDEGAHNFQIMQDVPIFSTWASNLGDSLTTDFGFATIVVDLSKMNGVKLSSIADYAAMLTLAQTNNSDTCLNLPSISNLFASGCDPTLKADALTENDIAYLKALYTVDNAGLDLNLQQADIAGEMHKDLSAQ